MTEEEIKALQAELNKSKADLAQSQADLAQAKADLQAEKEKKAFQTPATGSNSRLQEIKEDLV